MVRDNIRAIALLCQTGLISRYWPGLSAGIKRAKGSCSFTLFFEYMKENMDCEELMAMIRKVIEEALSKYLTTKKEVLLTRAAVAKRLGVDCSTLWRWAVQGYLTPVHIGSHVWYRESDIVRLERGEREA